MKYIVIYGNFNDGRQWSREFDCYGDKNVDDVCSQCRFKFECFTEKDTVKIPITKLRKKYVDRGGVYRLGVRFIVTHFVPNLKVSYVKSGDRARLDFSSIRRRSETKDIATTSV